MNETSGSGLMRQDPPAFSTRAQINFYTSAGKLKAYPLI
jgi:hypothetical protein